MPAFWLPLAAIVALGCIAILLVLRLHVRRLRAADEADVSEAGYSPRLPAGLPAAFDAPDHAGEGGAASVPGHVQS